MKRLVRILGSPRLACVAFVLLALATWLGTLAQVELGLHAAQKRYFESFGLIHWLGPVPIPLPGANLVLSVLFVNLCVGGIVRLRKRRSTIGVLVAHAGIAILLLAGFVKHAFARDGHVTLYEGQSSGWYQSYYRYELAVARELDDGRLEELLVPHEDLARATEPGSLELALPEYGFALELGSWQPNCRPALASPNGLEPGPTVDGLTLQPREVEREAERNLAGLAASARFESGERQEALLWSASHTPWTVTAPDGGRYAVELRKERYPLPFRIALDDFRKEDHPRTAMPRSFESDVTIAPLPTGADGTGGVGAARAVRIEMNEPLRSDGLVVYQASWGPSEALPGEPLFSTFAVVENPADAWPLVGCIVIALGLALHFGQRLARWIRRSAERRARPARRPQAQTPGASSPARRAAAALIAGLGLGGLARAAADVDRPAPAPPELVELLGTLPVQDGGRVKPLSTYASFTLLRLNGKRSVTTASGERLGPTEWLLEVLLHAEHAARHPTFLVQDEAVAVALGLEADHDKRDRWTFEELAPAVPRLFDLAHEYGSIPSAERRRVEEQVLELADKVDTFLSLARHFDFARFGVVADDPELAGALAGQELAALSEILASAERLRAGAAGREVLDAAAEIALPSRALALFPPLDPAADAWLTPSDLAERARRGHPNATEHVRLVRRLEALYAQRDDRAATLATLDEIARETRALAAQRGQLESVDRERAYYRLDPVGWSLRTFVLAFLLVAGLWLKPRARFLYGAACTTAGLATLALATAIVLRCSIRGRPPVSTLYETVLFVTATGAALALVIEWLNRGRVALSAAAVLGLIGVFVANGYETLDGADTMPSLVAVLDTNFWLATHVTAITLGYSAGMLAALLASFWILIDRFQGRGARPDVLRELGRMVYGVTCFALFFSLVGTILGGIWANDSWGRFWGWDPKENGALLIVITQTLLLHARLTGLCGTRGLCLLAAFGGTVVAFSWWGVNLLGVGLHSYGFTSGIHQALWTYYGLQWSIVALGLFGARRRGAVAAGSADRAQEPAPAAPRQEANSVS